MEVGRSIFSPREMENGLRSYNTIKKKKIYFKCNIALHENENSFVKLYQMDSL